MALENERTYWVQHTDPYVFYDETEYRLIVELLGGVLRGKRILEIGCGAGIWTDNLSKLGAHVIFCDLDTGIVQQAQVRAQLEPGCGLVADMHRLPFLSGCFDNIFGSMVVHHAHHEWLGQEIARVLKPGGRAVFHENSARNPMLMLARGSLVGRFGIPQYSSPGEHPLRPNEIAAFAQPFASYRIHIGRMVFFQLAVKYLLRTEGGSTFSAARRFDDFLFRHVPFLRYLSYYQILEFRR